MFLVGKEELKKVYLQHLKQHQYQLEKQNITSSKGPGITLTYNKMKDIMKVIKSLENRGILLKKTTRKITSQE